MMPVRKQADYFQFRHVALGEVHKPILAGILFSTHVNCVCAGCTNMVKINIFLVSFAVQIYFSCVYALFFVLCEKINIK